MLRVLFVVRRDLETNPGADSVQVQKLHGGLQRLGVEVDICNNGMDNLGSQYDIVHFFNLFRARELYPAFRKLGSTAVKKILTPLYWPLERIRMAWGPGHYRRWQAGAPLRRELVAGMDMLAPAAAVEAEQVLAEYSVDVSWQVASVGTDIHRLPEEPVTLSPETVLCVGRIALWNNQLALARVCRQLGVKLVLAGPISDYGYSLQIRRENPAVEFTGRVDEQRLAGLYRSAALHVQPAWYAVPGLVNLDAAALGCRLIATAEGSARAYLGDAVGYCSPDDSALLKRLVAANLGQSAPPGLDMAVQSAWSWRHAAEITASIYKRLV
ncbi:MAG: glycosyltransferase [Firmicutes bacterium]|nr:glycosyltransferase [Bacillota bacterium]